MNFDLILKKIPSVAAPKKELNFNTRLKWTGIVLFLFLLLSNVPLFGSKGGAEFLKQISMLMGASFGSILTLGIGPIVTASIILQLLVGSKIVEFDLSTHAGKARFHQIQKLMAFAFCAIEAFAYSHLGAIVPLPGMALTIAFQLFLGGILIIFFDEIITKWGIGQGVSLFIAANISTQIFTEAFSFSRSDAGYLIGKIPALIENISKGIFSYESIIPLLFPLITTAIVFLIVIYAQTLKIEIPLAFGSIRGFGRKWPLKFIYTSVIPVILVSVVLINLNLVAQIMSSKGITFLGEYSGNSVVGGLMLYLSPPHNFLINVLQINISIQELLRVIFYSLFMIFGSAIFAIFWVVTSGMDASSVAKQIQSSGMQIPGFRRDPRVIEKVLKRYIMPLALMGGAFVGFLAAFGTFTGCLSRGTGILLMVMIIYQFYEQIATQYMKDMNPMLRKYFEM
ncbi:MAG: preprotein translocase subunit SecY [Candidatus Aenigmarchaeota archaeon ex4484_52]|nr:MAG: preprotein translocase subunit SecY [Candidatus Aenigmarchaeota archaeon ex4484_52]